ncbi:MAG: hypothetical protein LBV14_12010 [Acidovorax sp.]|nr:hypothetical protein [Acidovorax sp.]
MDWFTLFLLLTMALYFLKVHAQKQRILLLASFLGGTQIEKLMATLMDGYLRAAGEADPQRQEQVWGTLSGYEQQLCSQFQRLADDFAQVPVERTRVSTLPLALPYFETLVPSASFDMRAALQLHAKALKAACAQEGMTLAERKAQAFCMTAELMLMQHSCHWFCKSRTVASVRLMARHKTSYEQVLEAVAPQTRRAYKELLKIA